MAAKESFGVLAVFERSRVVTFIGGRKELYTEILSGVFREEEIYLHAGVYF